jgi:Flp pilus assembly protein TadG
VAIIVAILAPVLLMFAAFAVDVARWYVEAERVQKVADAAALAGVVFMPQDFPEAERRALDVAADNGYANGGAVAVAVEEGPLPTQLRVTVTSNVSNAFGVIAGIDTTAVTRSAVADYNGPAPMGSPCNTFANEPPGTVKSGPIGSALPSPGFANCSSEPQFWANIHGPNVFKTQGDQYNTRTCQQDESGCSGGSNGDNVEFIDQGYFLVVKVLDPAKTGSIRLQIYDPAYVSVGSRCDQLPNSMPSNNMNEYATADAITRYDNAPNRFCTGDNDNSGLRVGAETPTITSFGLRSPVDSQNALDAPPYPGCSAVQFRGWDTPTASQLQQYDTPGVPSSGVNDDYEPELARVFHQWVDFCEITTPVAGQYYIQVRANVPLGGDVFGQPGDDTSVTGNGSNRFAVRALSNDGTQVSVAGWQRMPIFANYDASSTVFNLIRVPPAAAGKRVKFTFFDVGDAGTSGTVSMLPPLDGTVGGTPMTSLTSCTGEGRVNAALPSCQITGIQNTNGWNGQAQTILVPIPPNYSCTYESNGGCWFRVRVQFGSGQVTDATTWTASIEGDPVRLVE